MKLSRLILVSAFITAVILVIAGGVTSAVLANKSAAQAPAPQVVQEYQQREDQYKQAIQQANQQIEQANQNLQALQSQVTQLQGGAQPVSAQSGQAPAAAGAAAPTVAVSPQQAGQIAGKVAEVGQTVQKTPELVNFQGKAAYEVAFEKGDIYVDAQSGEVLFNGTVPQKVDANQAAKIAGDYLNNHDILKVDQVPFHGAQLWRVIFKNGTMAYLDATGQITYIQPRQVKVVVEQNSGGGSAPAASAPAVAPDHHESEHEGHGDD